MKRLLTPRKALAALVMGLGANSLAVSVGSLQGATVVGRPLDVSARVQLDARDEPQQCVRAEVFYGDAPVAGDRVNVQWGPVENASALVRVRSTLPVNEPVVTVVLHAGCQQPVTRRFVLLADPPGEAVAAAPLALPAPTQVAGAPRMSSARAEPARAAREGDAVRPVRERTRRSTVAVAGGKVSTSMQPPRTGGPRLRLEDAVLPQPREGLLRTSTELQSPPSADATQRAAAALLWQALNAQPQDMLRMGERIRRLETELASLRELSARHGSEVARLREEARRPMLSSFAHAWPWLGALVAAVALTAGFLGLRTSQSRRAAGAADDWFARPMAPQTDLDDLDLQLPAEPLRPAADASSGSVVPQQPVSAQTPLPRRPADEPLQAPAAEELAPLDFELDPAPAGAPLAGAADARSALVLRLDALRNALQEAEFLVSLGYAERAIDVLRGYVEGCERPSALGVLELLHLCRTMGDDEGVEATEAMFRALFGEEPPRADAAGGLEACDAALARVMAAWPAPEVLEVLAELLFSTPAALGGFPSVHAWRDLMWLHGLAEDTLHGAARTPAAAEPASELTLERLAAADADKPAGAFALDFDLSTPSVRHSVLERQPLPVLELSLAPIEPPADPGQKPLAKPQDEEDFLEAAMAAEGRGFFIR